MFRKNIGLAGGMAPVRQYLPQLRDAVLAGQIEPDGGSIDNVDVWGKRKFAYEIDKKTEGIYIVLTFTAKSSTARSTVSRP